MDDKQKNIDAARAQGWHGLLYNASTASKGVFQAELAHRFGLHLPEENGSI